MLGASNSFSYGLPGHSDLKKKICKMGLVWGGCVFQWIGLIYQKENWVVKKFFFVDERTNLFIEHSLADSPTRTVGWSPKFLELVNFSSYLEQQTKSASRAVKHTNNLVSNHVQGQKNLEGLSIGTLTYLLVKLWRLLQGHSLIC